MIHPLLHYLSVLAALIIIVRCICIAAHLSRKEFPGHQLRFFVLAASYAICGGAAVASAFDARDGAHLLLLGMAGFFIAERRLFAIHRDPVR